MLHSVLNLISPERDGSWCISDHIGIMPAHVLTIGSTCCDPLRKIGPKRYTRGSPKPPAKKAARTANSDK
jgi:hypothetical protein